MSAGHTSMEPVPASAAWVVGAGYLGSALHELLVAGGWASWRIDLDPSRADARADATDPGQLAACGLPQPDVVFVAVSTAGGDAAHFASLYPEVCRAVATCCPQARLVLCSSTSVYGRVGGEVVTEETPCRPRREQGAILLEAERLVLERGGVVARLGALYGPGRCRAVQRYVQGEDCLGGDWDRWVNFIHRDDAASALVHLAQVAAPGSIYNVSDATPMQKGQFFSLMWESTGLPFPMRASVRAGKAGATSQRVDTSALRATGWAGAYPSLASALAELLAAFAGEPGE